MDEYSKEFASDMRQRELTRAHWIFKWSFYCHYCDGYGVSTNDAEITQPCQCVLKEQCPRCGAAKAVRVSNHHPIMITTCTRCGWEPTQGGLPT